jgi:hypothetical protein
MLGGAKEITMEKYPGLLGKNKPARHFPKYKLISCTEIAPELLLEPLVVYLVQKKTKTKTKNKKKKKKKQINKYKNNK